MLLHRKNDSRAASSCSLTRYGAPGAAPVRVPLAPEQEVGAHQHAAEGHLDARVEVAALASQMEETQQHVEVAVVERPPERPASQPPEDLTGAGRFLRTRRRGGGRRAADEDGAAAGGVAAAGDVVRPPQLDAADARIEGLVARVLVARHRVVRPAHAFQHRRLIDEGHREPVRAGGHAETHLPPVVGRVPVVPPLLVARGIVHGAAHGQGPHQGAVEPHLELVPAGEAAQPSVVGAREVDLDDVLAVHGEGMPHREPTPRPERQVVADPRVLLQILVDGEDLRRRRQIRVAHRQPADLPRRRQIALGQHRRHRQHVGDVVEAVAGVVGRQEHPGVDLEREQVADGVGVLGPVQTVDGGAPAGVRGDRRSPVEGRFEAGGDPPRTAPRWDAAGPAEASTASGACARPSPTARPRRGVRRPDRNRRPAGRRPRPESCRCGIPRSSA